ncbi:Fic family protein [Nocardiopsis coralliicola]
MNAVTTDPLQRIAELPGVQDGVDSTRTVVDRLLGHRILRRRSADVSLESALRGAHASAVLEGAAASLDEVRAGESDDPWIAGALRVSGELGTLVETWPKAPRQVLARLHTLAAADTPGPAGSDALGRPRGDGEAALDPLGLGAPPRPGAVEARLEALAGLLSAPARVPALVVGAIVHGELLALRPFGRADGVVARAAERLTLIHRGLDPKSLVPPELGHLQDPAAYAEALRGYTSGTPDGVAAWVLHCCESAAAGARDSLATCEALKRG